MISTLLYVMIAVLLLVCVLLAALLVLLLRFVSVWLSFQQRRNYRRVSQAPKQQPANGFTGYETTRGVRHDG